MFDRIKFPRFPTTANLKQLELRLDVRERDTLFSCASLIRSFPLLQRFALQVSILNLPLQFLQHLLVIACL